MLTKALWLMALAALGSVLVTEKEIVAFFTTPQLRISQWALLLSASMRYTTELPLSSTLVYYLKIEISVRFPCIILMPHFFKKKSSLSQLLIIWSWFIWSYFIKSLLKRHSLNAYLFSCYNGTMEFYVLNQSFLSLMEISCIK